MTTEAAEKPKTDRMAKAREVRAANRAKRGQEQEGLSKLTSMMTAFIDKTDAAIAGLRGEVKGLATRPASTPMLPRTGSPEVNIKDSLRGMAAGEKREGSMSKDMRNPELTATGLQPRDFVKLIAGTYREKKFREALGSAEGDPIYGQVLQYLGVSRNAGGLRKYKVHFEGIGKDGVTENEVEFVRAGS